VCLSETTPQTPLTPKRLAGEPEETRQFSQITGTTRRRQRGFGRTRGRGKMVAATGPSEEWIAAFKAETGSDDDDGMMYIGPTPEFAWCCEQILGGYSPSVVITAMRENSASWRRVRELHCQLLSTRLRTEPDDKVDAAV
jgi:hypothetical protein